MGKYKNDWNTDLPHGWACFLNEHGDGTIIPNGQDQNYPAIFIRSYPDDTYEVIATGETDDDERVTFRTNVLKGAVVWVNLTLRDALAAS